MLAITNGQFFIQLLRKLGLVCHSDQGPCSTALTCPHKVVLRERERELGEKKTTKKTENKNESRSKKRLTKPQPTGFMADTLTTQPPRWIMEKAMGFVVKALCILSETQPPCPPEPRQLGPSLSERRWERCPAVENGE